jgi:CheY-like chemotaxis protein
LVVDDNARLRALWIEVLEEAGYRAIGSEDGLSAADLIRDLFPDLILLDLRMPRASGWDFLENVRANPRWHTIPVVLVSAHLEEGPDLAGDSGLLSYAFEVRGQRFLVVDGRGPDAAQSRRVSGAQARWGLCHHRSQCACRRGRLGGEDIASHRGTRRARRDRSGRLLRSAERFAGALPCLGVLQAAKDILVGDVDHRVVGQPGDEGDSEPKAKLARPPQMEVRAGEVRIVKSLERSVSVLSVAKEPS